MAVVRQLGDGSTRFVSLSTGAIDTAGVGSAWVDVIGDDATEGAMLARALGAPDAAVGWLDDQDRNLGPRVEHGVLHLGLTSANDFVTLVVASDDWILTVHESGDALVDACVVRLGDAPDLGISTRVVLALVDEAIERCERLVEQLGREHEEHAVAVVGRSSSVQSSEEVVADGLQLARDIADAQRQVRRLEAILHGLRLASSTRHLDPQAVEAAIDARVPEIASLQSDLDSLDRHLELTTNARMSLISARQTEINKAIGAWGGVFAVNAVITGWYGMNIGGLPGSGSWVTASAVMVVVTVALIALFRRIDWL